MNNTIIPSLFQTLENTLNQNVLKAVSTIKSVKEVVNRTLRADNVTVFPALLPLLLNEQQGEEMFVRVRFQDENNI